MSLAGPLEGLVEVIADLADLGQRLVWLCVLLLDGLQVGVKRREAHVAHLVEVKKVGSLGASCRALLGEPL